MIHVLLGLAGLAGIGGLLFRIFMPAVAKPVFAAAGALLGRIPPKGWIAIGVAAALVVGFFVHQRRAHQALAEAYAHGEADSDAAWSKRLDDEHKAALRWKAQAEAKQSTISKETGARHDQDLHSIASRADDQRLRGPGRAAAAGCGPGGAARLPAAGGGPVAPAGAADAALAGVPADEPLAIVPWNPLVAYGAEHDALLSEVKAWREWYARQADLNRQLREGHAQDSPTKG